MDFIASSKECFSPSMIASVIKRDLIELPSQTNSILSDLNEQRRSGRFCDVALHCRGETVNAHSCVLSCVSKYFETLFTTPLSTNTTSVHIIDLDEYSSQAVGLLVDLIYTQVDIPYSSLIELLKLAVFVQFDKLVKYLVGVIRPIISDTNVLQWLEVAHQCGCTELIWLTECFVREDYEKLHWKAMSNGTNIKQKLSYIQNSKIQKKKKEFIHVVIEDKREFILDVDKMLLSPHYPKESRLADCLPSSRNVADISISFVRNNMIFTVISTHKDFLVLDLFKYRHCSATLDKMRTYEFDRGMYFMYATYDGKNSLYLKIEKTWREWIFFKIDLVTGTKCEGHLEMEQTYEKWNIYDEYPRLLRIHDGMYFLSLDSIVKVSDFDFDQTEYHTADEIPLSESISGLELVSHAKKRAEHGNAHFQSCNGMGYCVLSPKVRGGKYSILKLDLHTRSWVFIADIQCDPVVGLLCCNNIICIVTNRHYEDETNSKEIFFFNQITEKVEETSIELPVSSDDKFFKFPIFM